ncbi:MAG TPA: beta-propeller fold lactonase family protein [Verrucomicrobiae bacterium]|nr:beta-propeller fold lactonase family protein [Verrucomicrobiae bacterium]
MKPFVRSCLAAVAALALSPVLPSQAQSGPGYRVYVTDEKSGELTVIDGTSQTAIETFAIGKRPRGIRASPDGRTLFVAVSGTPISAPPKLDAHGNPIFQKGKDDDDDDRPADKSADGIAVIDPAQRRVLRKLQVGSDPEQLAISADGTRLYVSNEDIGTATVLEIATGKRDHIIPVSREPEGVGTTPDGKYFYVTCETEGEIYVVSAASGKVLTHFNVGGRPRSVDFLPDGSRAFIPSESAGQMHVIDAVHHKLLKTVALPPHSRPMCVKVAPDGKKVYVSTGRAGTICVLDARSLEVLNTIKVGARPWGIALTPDGKYLYAANGPSDDVSVVDLASEKEIKRIKAGGSPWGVAIAP